MPGRPVRPSTGTRHEAQRSRPRAPSAVDGRAKPRAMLPARRGRRPGARARCAVTPGRQAPGRARAIVGVGRGQREGRRRARLASRGRTARAHSRPDDDEHRAGDDPRVVSRSAARRPRRTTTSALAHAPGPLAMRHPFHPFASWPAPAAAGAAEPEDRADQRRRGDEQHDQRLEHLRPGRSGCRCWTASARRRRAARRTAGRRAPCPHGLPRPSSATVMASKPMPASMSPVSAGSVPRICATPASPASAPAISITTM